MSVRDTVLAAIEDRVREAVRTRLAAVNRAYTTVLRAAFAAEPGATGAEVTSRPQVHAALRTALAGAHTAAAAQVRAGWTAAAKLATRHTAAELGHRPTPGAADDGYLDAVLADLRAAYDGALHDITATVAAAHDSATGPATGPATAASPGPGRALVDSQAAWKAMRRLAVRAEAAATVAVHRGYTDTQLALHAANAQRYLTWRKTWQVTSANPCPACTALSGTTVGLGERFDPQATADATVTPPRVYRDLTGPPRHPGCRCRIVIAPTAASAQLHSAVAGIPAYRWLTAAQVRRLPESQYQALVALLTAAIARVAELLRRVRDGQ